MLEWAADPIPGIVQFSLWEEVPATSMKRWWWLLAFSLGVVGLIWSSPWNRSPALGSSPSSDLAEALDSRPIEVRLAGGFRHSRCAAVPRPVDLIVDRLCSERFQKRSPESRDFLRLADRIREEAKAHPKPSNLR